MFYLQVWFQNRRAKFRRNERNMLAQRSSLYGSPRMDSGPLEQPIGPRPTSLNPEYLGWPAGGTYSPVATSPGYNMSPNSMGASTTSASSCAYAAQGVYSATPPSVGSSIATLRLKAREYNMQQQHYMPHHHQMAQWPSYSGQGRMTIDCVSAAISCLPWEL